MKVTFAFTSLLVMASVVVLPLEVRASIFIEPMYEARVEATPNSFCPIAEKLENICLNVNNRTKAPKPFGVSNSYLYQKKIYDAACAIPDVDDDETTNKKIRAMWSGSREQLKCNSVQFDVAGGNILKFAVSSKFSELLDDAIWWGVDLNWVDEHDKRTVLDYVQDKIVQNKGLSIETTLRHYYKILREAGAKHSHELKTEK